MKKIFTLFAGLLLAVAVFAADRRPTVTVNSSRNYKIVIDGRTYFGSNFMTINLDNFYGSNYGGYGSRQHTIKVYEMRRGYFVRERLVDAATFMVGRNDIMIKIDFFGQIRIREMRDFGRFDRDDRNGRGNNSWDDKRWDGGQDYNGHDNGGGRDNGQYKPDVRDNGQDKPVGHDNGPGSRDGRGKGF